MTRFIRTAILAISTMAFMGLAQMSTASADSHLIKHRKSIMKAVGGTMGGLAAVAKGKVSINQGVPISHAMYELSKASLHIFPEGSDFGETRAKEEIWNKKAEFTAAMDAFVKAAKNLSAVSHKKDKGQFAKAFGAVGKSCKGCHSTFRTKKK